MISLAFIFQGKSKKKAGKEGLWVYSKQNPRKYMFQHHNAIEGLTGLDVYNPVLYLPLECM